MYRFDYVWLISQNIRLAYRTNYGAASIAQWLEHWSCKPGAGSPNLAGGFSYFILFRFILYNINHTNNEQITLVISVMNYGCVQ